MHKYMYLKKMAQITAKTNNKHTHRVNPKSKLLPLRIKSEFRMQGRAPFGLQDVSPSFNKSKT